MLSRLLEVTQITSTKKRVRKSFIRVESQNTALRWGIVIARRQYSVPWPNSLWHLDGHHSLMRWGLAAVH